MATSGKCSCGHMAIGHRDTKDGANSGSCAMRECHCSAYSKPDTASAGSRFAAIPSHSTATVSGPWDGPAAEKNLPNTAAALRACYAWVDAKGDPTKKSSYKFPHHMVGSDGKVGAANTNACSAGIAVLNGGRGGSSIPASDRNGVYAHLAKHLKDAGKDVPEKKFANYVGESGPEPLIIGADGTVDWAATREAFPEYNGADTFQLVPAGATAPLPPMSNPIPFTTVLLQEGVWTSDGRIINVGATTPRQTPLTLMAMTKTADGHDGAEAAGRIERIERVPQADGSAQILGHGNLDGSSPIGLETARLVREQIVRGTSVDMAYSDVEFGESDKGLPTLTVVAGEILGATVCPMPAFEGCFIVLDNPDAALPEATEAMVASGAGEIVLEQPALPWHTVTEDGCQPCAEARESITASSAIPTAPPAEWFDDPQFTEPTPLTVTDEGRVFGHLAEWGTCHTAFTDSCVMAPRSATNYALFRTGCVQCDDGTVVATGVITMDTGHAPLNLDMAGAIAHYDDTGTAVADVVMGEDSHGPWMAGALRPGVTAEQIRTFRASPPSGDWRGRAGSLELIAVLAVNHPGFPIARVASGAPLALVAASNVQPPPEPEPGTLTVILTELQALRRRSEAERLAARIRK